MPFQAHASGRDSRSTRSDSNVDAARGNEWESDRLDAIALLTADHKHVAAWFDQFESARSEETKLALAEQICAALTVHATIEEEVFYPAFLEATGEIDLHHEAEVEHDGAKILIAEIEATGPDDEYFDAKVKVLGEMIKHHVNEEEQADGMFAKAKECGMDLDSLGDEMQTRKAELMDEMAAETRVD